MTLEASVLDERAVRRTDHGYEIDLHLAWYRSLPLSCVEDIRLSLDGAEVAPERIRVLRSGETLTLAQLADRVDDEWFVQDPLTLQVTGLVPAESGSRIAVDVTMATRIPYILIGPKQALVKPTRVRREVVVQ